MDTLIEFIMLNKFQIICMLAALIILSGACSKINRIVGLPDDNPIEQNVEKIIKEETGLEVDLTPQEKENGKEEIKSEGQESDEGIQGK